ncbi:NQO2 isoform 9 [Pongo abelii]|uniref:NQO2 isoform 9 n=1 Tax=Pongo abelii TaxID=9601 RepID=A0A2J8WME9_PONAB|nr:NQO2 isoform 9 [Pongo abelii]
MAEFKFLKSGALPTLSLLCLQALKLSLGHSRGSGE